MIRTGGGHDNSRNAADYRCPKAVCRENLLAKVASHLMIKVYGIGKCSQIHDPAPIQPPPKRRIAERHRLHDQDRHHAGEPAYLHRRETIGGCSIPQAGRVGPDRTGLVDHVQVRRLEPHRDIGGEVHFLSGSPNFGVFRIRSTSTFVISPAASRSKKWGTRGSAFAGEGRFDWDADYLCYSVREPFPSRTTGTAIVGIGM